MEELFASLIKDFVEETGPLAREVATLVLRLEEARANGEEVEELLRAMKSALHTIKGNAAMMGLPVIASVAHALEDYCLLVSQKAESEPSGQAQILVDGTDLLIRSIQGSVQGDAEQASVAAFLDRVARGVAAAGETVRA
ncbi:MAG: Hpt domain-containing protein, partial [Polyangia bacterium]